MQIDELDGFTYTQLLLWRHRVNVLIEEKRADVLAEVCGRFLSELEEAGLSRGDAQRWLKRRRLDELARPSERGEKEMVRLRRQRQMCAKEERRRKRDTVRTQEAAIQRP